MIYLVILLLQYFSSTVRVRACFVFKRRLPCNLILVWLSYNNAKAEYFKLWYGSSEISAPDLKEEVTSPIQPDLLRSCSSTHHYRSPLTVPHGHCFKWCPHYYYYYVLVPFLLDKVIMLLSVPFSSQQREDTTRRRKRPYTSLAFETENENTITNIL
jgi:hypothetical protein